MPSNSKAKRGSSFARSSLLKFRMRDDEREARNPTQSIYDDPDNSLRLDDSLTIESESWTSKGKSSRGRKSPKTKDRKSTQGRRKSLTSNITCLSSSTNKVDSRKVNRSHKRSQRESHSKDMSTRTSKERNGRTGRKCRLRSTKGRNDKLLTRPDDAFDEIVENLKSSMTNNVCGGHACFKYVLSSDEESGADIKSSGNSMASNDSVVDSLYECLALDV